MKRKRKELLIVLGVTAVLLSGCRQTQTEPVTRSGFLLNTFVTVTLYDSEDEAILDGCMELCREYDNVKYLDIASSVAVDGVLPDDVGTDGIHFNKEYSQKIIDYIKNNV